MSYSCSTRVRNRDWLVDIAAELPSSWHHCKFAEAVEISYIFLPLSSLEHTFVVTRSHVQVYSMWTFAGALQSLSGNGETLNQWRPNENTQTPSQALGCCRRCAHGMPVSKGASCCFLLSFCFDTSNSILQWSWCIIQVNLEIAWVILQKHLHCILVPGPEWCRQGRRKKLATNLWELLKSLELKRERENSQ